MDQKARKRKRRACDPCRKSKSRCEDAGSGAEDDPCRNCVISGNECTYLEPVRKRGPPKGYMSALEQRLNNAEAILGALICSTDTRAISLIADLSTDTLACSTLKRIREGEYGIGARANLPNGSQSNSHSPPQLFILPADESVMSNRDSEFNGPSLEWKDSLSLRLVSGAKDREASSSKDTASHNKPISSKSRKDSTVIADKEGNQLLSDSSDDVHMRDAEPTTISQTLRRELKNPPQPHEITSSSYNLLRGLKYKDRPVGLVLLFGLGIEPDCWNPLYRSII